MALTKYKLGELITLCTGGNEDLRFDRSFVKGISIDKTFMETKADLTGISLANYTVVEPKCFSFVTVTSRNGNKISIAYNDSDESFLVSSFYVTFRLNEFGKTVLLEDYLYMFFNRNEFDRYARRDSWGSAREYFYFDNICDVEITLPSISIQQKYVDIYKAMIANQQSYERGLEDLKLAIDGMLDQIKTEAPQIPLGELLAEIDNRNSDKAQSLVYGVTMSKQFIPSVANLDGVDISKYKLVATDQIACNFMHVGRDKSLPLAINQTDDPIVVSPAYFVFEKASEMCLPEYIVMWLSREESGRYCWFISDSSVRGGFSLEQFYSITIPVTSIDQQYALTSIYNSYITRKEINDKLKMQIKSICPILIKGSLEETK